MVRIAQGLIRPLRRWISIVLLIVLSGTVRFSFDATVHSSTEPMETVVSSSFKSRVRGRLAESLKKVAKVTKKPKFVRYEDKYQIYGAKFSAGTKNAVESVQILEIESEFRLTVDLRIRLDSMVRIAQGLIRPLRRWISIVLLIVLSGTVDYLWSCYYAQNLIPSVFTYRE